MLNIYLFHFNRVGFIPINKCHKNPSNNFEYNFPSLLSEEGENTLLNGIQSQDFTGTSFCIN